jgi:hypothetical protein
MTDLEWLVCALIVRAWFEGTGDTIDGWNACSDVAMHVWRAGR